MFQCKLGLSAVPKRARFGGGLRVEVGVFGFGKGPKSCVVIKKEELKIDLSASNQIINNGDLLIGDGRCY